MTITNSKYSQTIRIFLISSLLILLTSQFLLSSVLAQDDLGEIIMGVPANFPPQYYVDEETGEPYGFAIDIMDEIAARSDLEIRYVVFDTWPQVNQALIDGNIDAIPNMGITDERKEIMDFTNPVETFHISIFVRSTTADIHDIDDLTGRKVAVVEANKGLYIMKEHEGVELVIYNSLDEAFLSLISGNVDALVYPEPTVLQIAYASDLDDHIQVVGEPLLEVKRAIAVHKGHPELMSILDKEVKAFVTTPEYGEMYIKWNGEPEPYWNTNRVATTMGIILAIIVISLLSWHYFTVIGLNKSLKSSIAERERVDDTLKESEGRFKTMFNEAPLGIALINSLTGHIYEVNHMFAKIAGRTEEEMDTIDWMQITHPDDVQEDLDNMALLNAGKINGFQMEKRYIHTDGSFVWINMTIAPMKVMDKTQPRHLCMIEDITGRKKTEDALQSTTDYLNKLIDYTNAPFVVWDSKLKIIKVNHAFERLTGYDTDEIVNTELPMYFPKESRQQSMDQVKRASDGEYWESVEMAILQKDGNIKYMLWNSANLSDKDDENIKITIAQGIDITEHKRLADEVKQMNLDLEQKVEDRTSELMAVNKELEAFSYSVSHDLRAPLRSVDGFSQALLEDYGDKFDETGTDYLNRVRNATLDMGNLIDDLLNLSRITRGEMKYSEVDLSMLVSDIAKRYKAEDPNRQINYVIDEGVKANGDERLLRAMLENLMSNAYKFSSQEPIAKIKFGVTNINDENAYYIRDNGVGFDMKYADKLFGAFQRLHSKTEFPGTGIGLATVQRVIHKHGGHVWADSELGKGATFYFTI